MYDAKFTSGSLLFNEFLSLREIIENEDFESLLKQEEEQNNLMGVAAQTSRKRLLREVKRRRAKAPESFWVQFYHWNEREQKLALFFLCLKSYPLLLDIHLDLTLKKYKVGAGLEDYDIQMWLDDVSTRNEKVASWTNQTLSMIKGQYRKMLTDAGLLDEGRLTPPREISLSFCEYFESVKESWFIDSGFLN